MNVWGAYPGGTVLSSRSVRSTFAVIISVLEMKPENEYAFYFGETTGNGVLQEVSLRMRSFTELTP